MKKTDLSGVSKIILKKGRETFLIQRSGTQWRIVDDVSEVLLSDAKIGPYVDYYKKHGYTVTLNKDNPSLKTKLRQKTGKIKTTLEAVTKRRKAYTVPAATQVYWVKKEKK